MSNPPTATDVQEPGSQADRYIPEGQDQCRGRESVLGDRAGFLSLTVLAGGGHLLFKSALERAFPCVKSAVDPLCAGIPEDGEF